MSTATATKRTTAKKAPAKKATKKATPAKRAPATRTPSSAPAPNQPGDVDAEVRDLPIGDVLPSDDNPRKKIANLDALAESIRELGLLSPVLVRPHPTKAGKWELVAGERRHAAAKKAGLKTIRALPYTRDTADRLEAMLAENIHRDNLTIVEEARGFAALHEAGRSQRAIGARFSIDQSQVSRRIALLNLPTPALRAVDDETLSIDDAHELLKLGDDSATVAKIVETVKRKAQGYYSATVAMQVKQALDVRARAAQVADLQEKLTKKGATIVGPDDGHPDLTVLGIKEKDHEREKCHAVEIDDRYTNTVKCAPVCTDPGRHLAKGRSSLKAKDQDETAEWIEPTPTSPTSPTPSSSAPSTGTSPSPSAPSSFEPPASPSAKADRARKKLERDAEKARLAHIGTAVSTDALSPTRLATAAMRSVLDNVDRFNAEPRRALIEVLALDASAADQRSSLVEQLHTFADQGATQLRKAATAVLLVNGELVRHWQHGDRPRTEFKELMLELGYKPTKADAHLFKGIAGQPALIDVPAEELPAPDADAGEGSLLPPDAGTQKPARAGHAT